MFENMTLDDPTIGSYTANMFGNSIAGSAESAAPVIQENKNLDLGISSEDALNSELNKSQTELINPESVKVKADGSMDVKAPGKMTLAQLYNLGSIAAKIGGVIAGKDSTVGQLAQIGGQMGQAMAANEAQKTLMSMYLKGSGSADPQEGPAQTNSNTTGVVGEGLGGLDVAGLSPEQTIALNNKTVDANQKQQEIDIARATQASTEAWRKDYGKYLEQHGKYFESQANSLEDKKKRWDAYLASMDDPKSELPMGLDKATWLPYLKSLDAKEGNDILQDVYKQGNIKSIESVVAKGGKLTPSMIEYLKLTHPSNGGQGKDPALLVGMQKDAMKLAILDGMPSVQQDILTSLNGDQQATAKKMTELRTMLNGTPEQRNAAVDTIYGLASSSTKDKIMQMSDVYLNAKATGANMRSTIEHRKRIWGESAPGTPAPAGPGAKPSPGPVIKSGAGGGKTLSELSQSWSLSGMGGASSVAPSVGPILTDKVKAQTSTSAMVNVLMSEGQMTKDQAIAWVRANVTQ